MINIRPVSDLRNIFTETERPGKERKLLPYKKVHETRVVLSLEEYVALTDKVEMKFEEADRAAELDDILYILEEVFGGARARIHER